MVSDSSEVQRPPLFERVIEAEHVRSSRLAHELRITKVELATAIGLPAETLRKRDRERSRPAQQRLRDAVEILNRVSQWTGSDLQAYAWYRSEPLPAFGDRTASELVVEGLADAVKTHLARIAVGGFA